MNEIRYNQRQKALLISAIKKEMGDQKLKIYNLEYGMLFDAKKDNNKDEKLEEHIKNLKALDELLIDIQG